MSFANQRPTQQRSSILKSSLVKSSLAAGILLLIVSAHAIAQTPTTISYQGLLTNAGGAALPDGQYSMVFQLYSTNTGGVSVWQETQTVTLSKGLFNVYLGSVTPFATANLQFNQQLIWG